MSISGITSAVPANMPQATSKPASPQTVPAASLPTDTVTISPAAEKASKAGDVDRDGDSH